MPKKYEMRVIHTYKDAYETGEKYINNVFKRSDTPRLSEITDTKYPVQLYNAKWEMSLESLSNTLRYVIDFLHHQCYMLCINDNNVLLCKLDAQSTAPVFKEVLLNSVEEVQLLKNTTMNYRQHNAIRESVTKNIDNLRVMQCIVKPFAESTKTVKDNEYLDLLRGLNLPNGVFILNLTDAVILRNDGKSPFTMVTGKTDLGEHDYAKHIPILSISGQRNYLDVPIPNYDDVMFVLKTPEKYSAGAAADPDPSYTIKWEDKPYEKAVFRGGPTGCGYTEKTNMRIKLAKMRSSLLDAKLTNKDGNTVDSKAIKFDPKYGIGSMNTNIGMSGNFLTMADQSKYKYIIHVDGNVNAYRLLSTMLTGSLILRVTSQYTSWVDHMLQHKVHYIPVKADLSDLLDVIRWCKKNDDKCQEIAKNGMEFARSILSKKYIQSYLQNELWSLAEKRPVTIMDEKVIEKPRKTQKQSPIKNNKTMKLNAILQKGTVKKQAREAAKAEKEAIIEAAKAAKEAEKAAAKAAAEAAKAAAKAEKDAEKEAAKAAAKAEKEAANAAAKAEKEAEKEAAKAAAKTAKADEYEYIEMQPDQKKCPKGSSAAMVNGVKMCRKKKE
ncbi:MAG: glycosyl transferase family 90 [Flavobacterium sp.]